MASRHPGRTTETPRARYLVLLGLGAAALMVLVLAARLGGLSGLLTVGESVPIRSLIEEELPDVTIHAARGHDGQYFYAIARDPFASGPTPDLLRLPSYRYRRIGFPLVAGGFGTFSAETTVAGMLVLAMAGFGMSVVATYRLAWRESLPSWVAPVAAASLPALLSVRFLMADSLALGLGLLGILWFVEGRDKAALVALALATLTKEVYLLIPLAMAASIIHADRNSPDSRRRALWYVVWPTLPLALWSVFLAVRLGWGDQALNNLEWPFVGIVESIARWDQAPGREIAFAIFAMLTMVLAATVVVLVRDRILAWLVLPWIALLIISSDLIWAFGNNALRVAAPLWTLGVLGLGTYVARTSRRNLPV